MSATRASPERRRLRLAAGTGLLAAALGCRSGWPGREPPWPEPVTTRVETLVPGPRLAERLAENPVFPEGLAAARRAGLGRYRIGPGEPHQRRTDLGVESRPPLGKRRSLALLFHHSDPQLADAESPTRQVAMDNTAFPGAARPNELYACFALDAVARTVNRLSRRARIDLVVLTGDQVDSAQLNETRWLIDILDGRGPVHCDSGTDDSAPDEHGQDPLAPFVPEGLAVPWIQVPGNHDLLVNGHVAVTREDEAGVLGSEATWGTRDLSRPGGPLIDSGIAPDATRRLLHRRDLVEVYFDSPAVPGPRGHGFDPGARERGITWYVIDPFPGIPLRMIGLDTVNLEGDAEGAMGREQYAFLLRELERARAERRLVIVLSHHETYNVEVEGHGIVLLETLRQHDHVVAHLYGHGHRNDVVAYPAREGDSVAHGFWGIQTAALSDWPTQSRLLELVWNGGDGTLSLFSTMVDPAAPRPSLAETHRELTLIDWQSGWGVSESSPGDPEDRNVELLVAIPEELDQTLSQTAAPGPLRSLTELARDPRGKD